MSPSDAAARIAEIEALVARDPGDRRGAAALMECARGGLLGAARSITEHPEPHIGIITGFYLPHGEPPCCETDGPPGAAHLAAGFDRAGVPSRIVTDQPNAGAIRAAALAAGLPEHRLDVAAVSDGDRGTPVGDLLAQWARHDPPITHVVSIERAGPSTDGRCYNAHGIDIGAHNAPLDRLFTGGPWATIGIGDGGNELGMGSLPVEVIAANVRNGAKIACTVPCDHLMVCGVSNWGAVALLAAVAVLRPDLAAPLTAGLDRETDHRILHECVHTGPAVAVPDWTSEPHLPIQCMAVDGIPWIAHAELIEQVVALIPD